MSRRYPFLNLLSGVIAASTTVLMIGAVLEGSPTAQVLSALLLQMVMVVAALAVFIGALNLLAVHVGRFSSFAPGAINSLVVVLTAGLVVLVHVADIRASDDDRIRVSDVFLEGLQVALESALAGLIFFFLVYGAYRMMRERVTFGGLIFTTALLIVLLGALPLEGASLLGEMRDWVLAVPTTAGARGLLIGIALGTVTVGLRTLIGQEKAYRE